MTRDEIIAHFAEHLHLSTDRAAQLFDELRALAVRELRRTGEFVIPGIARLVVSRRKARMGRNPATGEAVRVPGDVVLRARVSTLAAGPLPGEPIPTPPRKKPKKRPQS